MYKGLRQRYYPRRILFEKFEGPASGNVGVFRGEEIRQLPSRGMLWKYFDDLRNNRDRPSVLKLKSRKPLLALKLHRENFLLFRPAGCGRRLVLGATGALHSDLRRGPNRMLRHES